MAAALCRWALLLAASSQPALAWNYSLPPHMLEAGVVLNGDLLRFDGLLRKLRAGEPIVVVAFGTSITQNGGCAGVCRGSPGSRDRALWFGRVFDWLSRQWPHPEHRFVNLGKHAGGLGTVDTCMRQLAPPKVDLFLTEWASMEVGETEDPSRRMERLMRHLMLEDEWSAAAPILLVHTFHWCRNAPGCPTASYASMAGTYLKSGEDRFNRIAQYYGQPAVSMRNAVYHAVGRQMPGYAISNFLMPRDMGVHLHAYGHLWLGDTVVHFFARAWDTLPLREHALSQGATPLALGWLPPPLFEGNFPTQKLFCGYFSALIYEHGHLRANLRSMANWSYSQFEPHSKLGKVTKPGLQSTTPGAQLALVFDTRARRASKAGVDESATLQASLSEQGRVWIVAHFFASYDDTFGTATARCVSGCICADTQIGMSRRLGRADGSRIATKRWVTTEHSRCALNITVNPDGRRFKLAAIVVEQDRLHRRRRQRS
jgi:hypothetical protein